MKTLKGSENWTLIESATTDGGQMVTYERNGYRITVSENGFAYGGGLDIKVTPVNKGRYTPNISVCYQYQPMTRKFGPQEIRIGTIKRSDWWLTDGMEVSELDQMVEAYTKAQTVAHEIMQAFPQCFAD